MTGSIRRNAGPLPVGRRSVLVWLPAAAGMLLGRRAIAEAPADLVVEMQKLIFAPADIQVPAGNSVTFVNLDLVPHTATAEDKSFDTGTLRKDERMSVVFPTPGEFPYICRFHPHMKGVIRVT